MVGKVLDVHAILEPDRMGTEIATNHYTWNTLRRQWMDEKVELRKYIFATDTTKTTNSKLPWKNKTTIPKICQIRDNLFANYMASMFPKRKSHIWVAYDQDSNTEQKRKAIEGYMCNVKEQKQYKAEMAKCVLDFIDYGNAFAIPEWCDERVSVLKSSTTLAGLPEKLGFVGPRLRRINPLDITFNPLAPSFDETPKILKSLVSMGEVKKFLNSLSTDGPKREQYTILWEYLKALRQRKNEFAGELRDKDAFYAVDGFTSFQAYLGSSYCELLTFYGDIYDYDKEELLENKIITVVDRHKIVAIQDNPSYFAKAPIIHAGWRIRPDNLWAMGPLDNLVGMQYRIDHIENLKADVFDLITFPPLKIKGHVDDFEWGPMARIYIGDNDGDVEMMAPPFNVLQANIEIQQYEQQMEEMAGAPKEAMGFRTPGEKTKYEVQRQENAASRIFQNKTGYFEEMFVEEGDNLMLELARRNITSDILIQTFNDEYNVQGFLAISPEDLMGQGRIRPFAARHFAEQAELVQNLTNYFSSPLGQITAPHWSSWKLAKMFEGIFDIEQYKLLLPFVALSEQADAQRMAQANEEAVLMELQTASGLTPDDTTGPQPVTQTPPFTQIAIAPKGPLGGAGY